MTDLPLLPMLDPADDDARLTPPAPQEDAPAAVIVPAQAVIVPAEDGSGPEAQEDAPTAVVVPAQAVIPAQDGGDPAQDAPTSVIPASVAVIPAQDGNADVSAPADEPAEFILPEEGLPADSAPAFRFTFAGRECFSRRDLALAMADAWDEARHALLTGALARELDDVDLVSAAICRDQAANIASGRFTADRGVLEAIHRLSEMPLVVWCGRRYASGADLGGSLLQALRGTGVIPVHCDSLLMSGAASVFADPAQKEALQAIEARYAAPDCVLREKTLLMYMVGYLLTGVAAYVLEGETFYAVEELSAWLVSRAKRSSAAFTHACHRLLDENHLLDPQLEAWLGALGRRQDVRQWQAEIDAGML